MNTQNAVRRAIYTRDGYQTYDAQTIDSAGAFLIGELERLDQRLHKPLVSVTWSRDIDLREDVSMGDETSSYTNSTFTSNSGVAGSNKAWVGKDSNVIAGASLDIGKTPNPLTLWALQLGWTIPELISAEKLGRPVDSQKFEAMQIKHQMDIDEMVYIGDAALGLTGMVNHTLMTNVGNAVNGQWAALITANATTAPDLILADVNSLLESVWGASGFAVCPDSLRIAPSEYSLLVATKVSSAGNMSILEYLRINSLSNAINGKPLDIQPLKWLVGTGNTITVDGVAYNGQGPAATDSMIAYSKNPTRIRFPLVPLQRTPLEYRDIRQLTTYFGRLGAVELVYPSTIGRRSNIG